MGRNIRQKSLPETPRGLPLCLCGDSKNTTGSFRYWSWVMTSTWQAFDHFPQSPTRVDGLFTCCHKHKSLKALYRRRTFSSVLWYPNRVLGCSYVFLLRCGMNVNINNYSYLCRITDPLLGDQVQPREYTESDYCVLVEEKRSRILIWFY